MVCMPKKATIAQVAKLSGLTSPYSHIAFNIFEVVAISGEKIPAANSILDFGYGKSKRDGIEVVEFPAISIQRG